MTGSADCPGDLLAPAIELARDGFRGRRGVLPGRRGERPDLRTRARSGVGRLDRRSTGPDGRPWQLGERVRLPALRRNPRADRREGWAEPYEGEPRRAARPPPWPARAPRSGLADLRDHRSTLDRADLDRLPGRPGDRPPAEQLGLRRPRAAQHPRVVRAACGTRPRGSVRWAHLGIEASKLAMADRDAHLTDPESLSGAARASCSTRATRGGWPAGSTRPGGRPAARPAASGRRHDLAGRGRRRRATRSA